MVPSALQSSETGAAGFCSAARAGQTYGPSSTAASSVILGCCWPTHAGLPWHVDSSYIPW